MSRLPEPPVPRLAVTRLVDGQRRGAAPLVLLHGFTGDASTWLPLVAELDRDRDVLAIDLVGHGESDAPGDPAAYTMPATVTAVTAACDEAGMGRAHWLGYSMGGRVALNLALIAPDRAASLALVGASPGFADADARTQRVAADNALADFIESEGVPAFVDRWMAHPIFASQARLGDDYLAQAREQRLRNKPHALACTLRGMGTGAMEPVQDDLAGIDVPVLLVTGEEDHKFERIAAGMVDELPDATHVTVPGAGHAVHVEAPGLMAQALRSFLLLVEAV